MSQIRYDVIVIMMTDDCVDRLDETIASVFAQTFDASRIKLVIIDNHSTDGTYEKAIQYASTSGVAVYREGRKLPRTRLLTQVFKYLQFTEYRYVAFLEPGDRLYPEFVATACSVLDSQQNVECSMLVCEADIRTTDGRLQTQPALYSEDCVLPRRTHCQEYFSRGTEHRIYAMFSKIVAKLALPETPYFVDFTDWFKKGMYGFWSDAVYLKTPLACTLERDVQDPVHDLLLRYYLIKRIELGHRAVSDKDVLASYVGEECQKRMLNSLLGSALKFLASARGEGNQDLASRLSDLVELISGRDAELAEAADIDDSRARLPAWQGATAAPPSTSHPLASGA